MLSLWGAGPFQPWHSQRSWLMFHAPSATFRANCDTLVPNVHVSGPWTITVFVLDQASNGLAQPCGLAQSLRLFGPGCCRLCNSLRISPWFKETTMEKPWLRNENHCPYLFSWTWQVSGLEPETKNLKTKAPGQRRRAKGNHQVFCVADTLLASGMSRCPGFCWLRRRLAPGKERRALDDPYDWPLWSPMSMLRALQRTLTQNTIYSRTVYMIMGKIIQPVAASSFFWVLWSTQCKTSQATYSTVHVTDTAICFRLSNVQPSCVLERAMFFEKWITEKSMPHSRINVAIRHLMEVTIYKSI